MKGFDLCRVDRSLIGRLGHGGCRTWMFLDVIGGLFVEVLIGQSKRPCKSRPWKHLVERRRIPSVAVKCIQAPYESRTWRGWSRLQRADLDALSGRPVGRPRLTDCAPH